VVLRGADRCKGRCYGGRVGRIVVGSAAVARDSQDTLGAQAVIRNKETFGTRGMGRTEILLCRGFFMHAKGEWWCLPIPIGLH
jgi:hypothetical protein